MIQRSVGETRLAQLQRHESEIRTRRGGGGGRRRRKTTARRGTGPRQMATIDGLDRRLDDNLAIKLIVSRCTRVQVYVEKEVKGREAWHQGGLHKYHLIVETFKFIFIFFWKFYVEFFIFVLLLFYSLSTAASFFFYFFFWRFLFFFHFVVVSLVAFMRHFCSESRR